MEVWNRNPKKIPVNILARRNKRHSVANAITVTGVREALLIGDTVEDQFLHHTLPRSHVQG